MRQRTVARPDCLWTVTILYDRTHFYRAGTWSQSLDHRWFSVEPLLHVAAPPDCSNWRARERERARNSLRLFSITEQPVLFLTRVQQTHQSVYTATLNNIGAPTRGAFLKELPNVCTGCFGSSASAGTRGKLILEGFRGDSFRNVVIIRFRHG